MKSIPSHRYFHERTGEPMPAYVIGEFVVEKNRDPEHFRVAGQTRAMWAGPKEWWEVRRQGSRTQPGVSIGRELFQAPTLRECRAWIEGRRDDKLGTS